MLSPARRQITHVLLTRAPLYRGRSPFSCDLHVLGAPLTFVLSQDQTLQLNPVGQRIETYCSMFRRKFLSLMDIVRWVLGSGDPKRAPHVSGDPRCLSQVCVALSFQGSRGNSGLHARVPGGGVKTSTRDTLCQRIFPAIFTYFWPVFAARNLLRTC